MALNGLLCASCAVRNLYTLTQWRRHAAWGTGARAPLEFANAHKFCRPNARWLSLLDDCVTTNFGTRAPQARAPTALTHSVAQLI